MREKSSNRRLKFCQKDVLKWMKKQAKSFRTEMLRVSTKKLKMVPMKKWRFKRWWARKLSRNLPLTNKLTLILKYFEHSECNQLRLVRFSFRSQNRFLVNLYQLKGTLRTLRILSSNTELDNLSEKTKKVLKLIEKTLI